VDYLSFPYLFNNPVMQGYLEIEKRASWIPNVFALWTINNIPSYLSLYWHVSHPASHQFGSRGSSKSIKNND